MREKRLSGRLPVNLSAELWDIAGEFVLSEVRLVELSPTGVKVCYELQEISLPANVKIKFGLEKATPFFFEAEVIWSKNTEAKTFVGIKFKNLNMINKEKIRGYIHNLKYDEKYTM